MQNSSKTQDSANWGFLAILLKAFCDIWKIEMVIMLLVAFRHHNSSSKERLINRLPCQGETPFEILDIRPSAMWFKKELAQQVIKCTGGDSYRVCYSCHSSLTELRQFVAYFQVWASNGLYFSATRLPFNHSKCHFCSVLDKSHLGADHHIWVKTRFGILVKSSFTWANQVWPRAILAPKNDKNKKVSD